MPGSPRPTRWKAALGLALASITCAAAGIGDLGAQMLTTQGEGLPLGRFVLFPSMTFDLSHDDNLFRVSQDRPEESVIASGAAIVMPRLIIDLPLSQNSVRLGYAMLYRDYSSDQFDQSDKISQFFDFESKLHFGPSFTARLSDHVVRGTVELQEVDPGGELTFGLVPFRVHSPEAEITVNLGARQGLSLIPRYSDVSFDDPDAASFFAYQRRDLEGRYNYRVARDTTFYGYYAYETTDQDRNAGPFENVSYDARRVGLGAQRALTETVRSQVSVGYESNDFTGGYGENFRGLSVDANTVWRLSDITRLDVTARRRPFQSFFVNNNYYLNSELGLKLLQQIGRSSFWQVGASYADNKYPSEIDCDNFPEFCLDGKSGPRRQDSLLRLELGIGHRFLDGLRMMVGYNLERRRSNVERDSSGVTIDAFSYSSNKFLFRIEVGWL